MTKGQHVQKHGDRLLMLAVCPAASGGRKPLLTDLRWTGWFLAAPMTAALICRLVGVILK